MGRGSELRAPWGELSFSSDSNDNDDTPGLHNKIPVKKVFARGWVAQEPICS